MILLVVCWIFGRQGEQKVEIIYGKMIHGPYIPKEKGTSPVSSPPSPRMRTSCPYVWGYMKHAQDPFLWDSAPHVSLQERNYYKMYL
jgi:hypothetical protein